MHPAVFGNLPVAPAAHSASSSMVLTALRLSSFVRAGARGWRSPSFKGAEGNLAWVDHNAGAEPLCAQHLGAFFLVEQGLITA